MLQQGRMLCGTGALLNQNEESISIHRVKPYTPLTKSYSPFLFYHHIHNTGHYVYICNLL